MKVAIYSQMFQDDTTEYVSKLLDELEKHGAEVAIEEDLCAYLKSTSLISTSTN